MANVKTIMMSLDAGLASAKTPTDIAAKVVKKKGHFVALDSWRGICAMFVAIFHLPVAGMLTSSTFILHSALFVDFFFVLSGFVIAANYIDRINDGSGFKQFAWLRIGRLYPLHLAIFLAYFAVEAAKLAISMATGSDITAFTGGKPWQAIGTNLLLIQSLGFHSFETWNLPSWSISTEMFAYFAFAVLTMFGKSLRYYLYALTIVLCMAFLWMYYPEWGSRNAEYGVFRCLAGFFAGVFAWRIWKYLDSRSKGSSLSTWQWTWLEGVAIVTVILFVIESGLTKVAFISPYVFGVVVIIFGFDRGHIAKLMQHRSLQFLGMLSYSIYMVHQFLVERLLNFGKIVDKVLGTNLVMPGVDDFASFTMTGPLADLFVIAFVGLVTFVSYLTYRFIEVPCRDWFRVKFGKKKKA